MDWFNGGSLGSFVGYMVLDFGLVTTPADVGYIHSSLKLYFSLERTFFIPLFGKYININLHPGITTQRSMFRVEGGESNCAQSASRNAIFRKLGDHLRKICFFLQTR
jgi:hypothetical protein